MDHQEIYCTVSSCFYYAPGDKCNAERIQVQNNPTAARNANMEVGAFGGQAAHSNQTLCNTFVPKENGPKPGVSRINGQ